MSNLFDKMNELKELKTQFEKEVAIGVTTVSLEKFNNFLTTAEEALTESLNTYDDAIWNSRPFSPNTLNVSKTITGEIIAAGDTGNHYLGALAHIPVISPNVVIYVTVGAITYTVEPVADGPTTGATILVGDVNPSKSNTFNFTTGAFDIWLRSRSTSVDINVPIGTNVLCTYDYVEVSAAMELAEVLAVDAAPGAHYAPLGHASNKDQTTAILYKDAVAQAPGDWSLTTNVTGESVTPAGAPGAYVAAIAHYSDEDETHGVLWVDTAGGVAWRKVPDGLWHFNSAKEIHLDDSIYDALYTYEFDYYVNEVEVNNGIYAGGSVYTIDYARTEVKLKWDLALGSTELQRVYRGAHGGALTQLSVDLSTFDTTFTDTTAFAGTSYDYEIRSSCVVSKPQSVVETIWQSQLDGLAFGTGTITVASPLPTIPLVLPPQNGKIMGAWFYLNDASDTDYVSLDIQINGVSIFATLPLTGDAGVPNAGNLPSIGPGGSGHHTLDGSGGTVEPGVIDNYNVYANSEFSAGDVITATLVRNQDTAMATDPKGAVIHVAYAFGGISTATLECIPSNLITVDVPAV